MSEKRVIIRFTLILSHFQKRDPLTDCHFARAGLLPIKLTDFPAAGVGLLYFFLTLLNSFIFRKPFSVRLQNKLIEPDVVLLYFTFIKPKEAKCILIVL